MKKIYLPESLVGELTILKKHTLALAEEMFRYVDQDRERLKEFLPWVDFTCSVDDERSYIKMTQEKWAAYELFDFGIFRKEDGTYLGNIGVHTLAWGHDRCELGYWVLGAYEGQGYISDAVKTLEAELFSSGFNRIEIHCSSANAKSASVPRRNAYLLEGTLRQDAVERGQYRDTYIFGKLKSDFRQA